MSATTADPAMTKIREIWLKKQAAGMTLEELGRAMGLSAKAPKQAADQFVRGADTRVSTLRRFARAVGVSAATLVRE